MIRLLLVILILSSAYPQSLIADESISVKVKEKVILKTNPHEVGAEGCRFCHLSYDKEKAPLLDNNIDLLCSRCHEMGKDHIVDPFPYDEKGIADELLKRGATVSADGMNCLTCHEAHPKNKKASYLNAVTEKFYLEVKSIDPHWRKGYCLSCHLKNPSESPGDFKRNGDIVKVCNNCHEYISDSKLIHAVGMEPSKNIKTRMPGSFALSPEGKVSCITCHELKYQCLEKEFYRKKADPMFFRGGPYGERTQLCYKCHKKENYDRLNPHDQINDMGELIEERCLYCHNDLPDPQRDKDIYSVSFVTDDLKDLCQRCHRDRPHPGGHWVNFDHLVKPPANIRRWMSRVLKTMEVVLPLAPDTDKMFCCTCHNPHERGVLRGKYDKGADDDRRLRLGAGFELCSVCHMDNARVSK